jgi:hypothetical protein
MFVTIIGDRVHVRLSRRNLRQLDSLLDGPVARGRCLARKDKSGVSLIVQVEDDAEHYEGRDPGPGLGKARAVKSPQPMGGPIPSSARLLRLRAPSERHSISRPCRG